MTRKSSKKSAKENRSKEPEVERFRSLEELNAAFSQRRTIAFRSIEELSKDFQTQRQPPRDAEARGQIRSAPRQADESSSTSGTGVLKKIFEGRGFGFITPDHDNGEGDVFLHFSDVTGADHRQAARSLTIGTWVRYDVEPDAASGRLRAKNVSVIPSTSSTTSSESPRSTGEDEAEVATITSSSTRSYNRDIMLGIFKALASSSRLAAASKLKLSTVHVPRPASRSVDQEDPCLDDERLLARLEARLDKETGADALNMQTFGACSGWSFEEAVAANEKIRVATEFEDSTTAGGSFSEPADVEVSERGEESDASEDRKETRQEVRAVDEEAPLAADKWSWEGTSVKAKILEDHRQSRATERQQMTRGAAPPQVFQ